MVNMRHRVALFGLVFVLAASLASQTPPELTLKAGDVRVESRSDGFHLIVKQKAGVN